MGRAQASVAVITLKDGRTRRFRSKQERRQIVEETLKAGASVSLVARAHDVNANQVFKWRKQYREGRLDVTPAASPSTLLPVKISDALPLVRPTAARRRPKARRVGIIVSVWRTPSCLHLSVCTRRRDRIHTSKLWTQLGRSVCFRI
jgi:transposase-like protein